MTTGTSIVQITQCRTATELLDAIAGTHSRFASGRPYSWLFRGVASSDYTLTPSALRTGALERFTVSTSDFSQIDNEWKVLKAFFELADLRGMPLPEDSQRMRSLIQSLHPVVATQADDPEFRWPPPELLSLCGLAQHYGLPTRLLDWTFDPRVAAYFAARGVMSYVQDSGQQRPIKTMAVWAFNKTFDDSLRLRERFAPPQEPVPYEMVTIPYATNPNIQAQQGVFTVVRHSITSRSIDRTPFDKTLFAYLECCFPELFKSGQPANPLFIKFELPWAQFEDLLRRLANAGVNASTVFPGYYGVVDAVREKLWWWDA